MIKEFTVDRKTWQRGEGPNSALLGRDGRKCCLGFLALACGHTEADIFGVSSPFDLFDKDKSYMMPPALIDDGDGNEEGIITCDSFACIKLMDTNDDKCITESFREEQLTKGFESLGIKVTFEG